MRMQLVALLAGISLCGIAQEAPAPKHAAAPATAISAAATANSDSVEVPVYWLNFTPKDPVQGTKAPGSVALPIHCSPDGAAFLNALFAPDFSTTRILAISSKDVVTFSTDKIPDLQNIQLLDDFPSKKSLDVLIYAAPKSTDGSSQPPKPASYHQYLVSFHRDGSYEKTVQLPPAVNVYRFAVLASGNFLLSGFDAANNVPRLLLLSPDGDVLQQMDMPAALEKTETLSQREGGDQGPSSVVASQMFSQAMFTAQSGGVVYWTPGTATVLSITGDTRLDEIKLQAPSGYSLASFVPSDSEWIVSFRRSNLPESVAVDARASTRNFLMYEVNRRDGSLMEELRPTGSDPAWTACADNGKLTAFAMDKQSNLIPYTADVP